MAAAAARLRLLLRQAAVRPAAPRGRVVGARPPRAPTSTTSARLVRFLENHDEPRAAAVLPPERERAAAVAVATLPGATLWHEGQFEGWRVRLPVFLGRRPDEPVDEELRAFHLLLIAAAAAIAARRLGALRGDRLARQPQLRPAARLVVDRRGASLARRGQRRRRPGVGAHPAAVGRPRRADVAARRPARRRARTSATGPSWPPRASTCSSRRGSTTSWSRPLS